MQIPETVTQSRVWQWKDIELWELKNFLALYFLTGVIAKPSLELYWDTREVVKTPFFPATMSRNRFQLILRFIHFSDNGNADPADRLYKVRPVLDFLLGRFRALYTPAREIAIDEGMMKWRGRLQFRVYNPQVWPTFHVVCYVLYCVLCGRSQGISLYAYVCND